MNERNRDSAIYFVVAVIVSMEVGRVDQMFPDPTPLTMALNILGLICVLPMMIRMNTFIDDFKYAAWRARTFPGESAAERNRHVQARRTSRW